jgi:hypothetical protein
VDLSPFPWVKTHGYPYICPTGMKLEMKYRDDYGHKAKNEITATRGMKLEMKYLLQLWA